jgi:hypothetical protein
MAKSFNELRARMSPERRARNKSLAEKLPVQRCAMRVRAYPVLVDAVSAGVARGWHRAHKHDDEPDEEAIRAAVEDAVLGAICEAFDFPEDWAE